MNKNLTKNFFKQKGKPLNKIEELSSNYAYPREVISSLSNVKPSKRELIYNKIQLLKHYAYAFTRRDFLFSKSGWGALSVVFTIFFAMFVFKVPVYTQQANSPQKYSVFAAKPLTLEAMDQDFVFRDSRAVKIDSVFKFFKCPLEGYGNIFVEKADENNIPYWIVAAISFQESSCGKNTPKLNGEATSNAWGWATYGDQVYEFDSFEHGIDVVSRYMSKRFFSQGITEPCDIMKVYTPPSKGSWCKGVQYFGDFIQNYSSPQI